jgi:hypothetical protein
LNDTLGLYKLTSNQEQEKNDYVTGRRTLDEISIDMLHDADRDEDIFRF